NHGEREAVARCPSCARHYCRECVTEHDHRILCATCIAALTTETTVHRRHLPFADLLRLGTAIFTMWIAFYVMGQALLLIPSAYHDSPETFLQQIKSMEEEEALEKTEEKAKKMENAESQEDEGADSEESDDEAAENIAQESAV